MSLTHQQIDDVASFVFAQLDPAEGADRATLALRDSVRQMRAQAHALNPERPDHALAHEVVATALLQIAHRWSDLPDFPTQRECSSLPTTDGSAGHAHK